MHVAQEADYSPIVSGLGHAAWFCPAAALLIGYINPAGQRIGELTSAPVAIMDETNYAQRHPETRRLAGSDRPYFTPSASCYCRAAVSARNGVSTIAGGRTAESTGFGALF